MQLQPAIQPIAEIVIQLHVGRHALFFGNQVEVGAEIELAQPDADVARGTRHGLRDARNHLRVLGRDGVAVRVHEQGRQRAGYRRQAQCRFHEIRHTIEIRVEGGGPHRRIGGISGQRRHQEAARVADGAQIVADRGKALVRRGQRLAVQHAECQQDVRAVGAAAVQQAELPVVLRISVDGLDIQLQVQAPEVAAGDEVHHAGHGVGAVQRGGAVLQGFNPVEGDHRRQRRGIDKVVAAVRGHGAVHLAAGVEQHQGGIHAQAAQVDIRRARASVLGERVGVVLRPRVDGHPLDDVADLVDAQIGDVLEADGGQRRG